MNILIAADSFKDSLSAMEVCRALKAGISAANPDAIIRVCPMADGGEGTFEVLTNALGLEQVEMPAFDPLFRSVTASYGRSKGGETAFIEMAKTAGLQLLRPEERNPLITTTFGVGQQIHDALNKGAEHIILAIGGSATNDMGIGMAKALGWAFFDKNGSIVHPVGGNLNKIALISPPVILLKATVEVICDVTNPLFGPMGAANVYAAQKGANAAEVALLDEGMQHFTSVAAQTGKAPDPMLEGTGAAGGLGFGAMYFLNASLKRGVMLVMDLLNVDEKLKWADIVVTGEGKIDFQTAQGKLIQGLCQRASKYNTPVIAFCGQLDATENEIRAIGLQEAYSINDPEKGHDLALLLQNTGKNLANMAHRVFSQRVFQTTRP